MRNLKISGKKDKDGWEAVFKYQPRKDVTLEGNKKKNEDGTVSVGYSEKYKGNLHYGSNATVENDLRAERFFYNKLYEAVLDGTWLIMQTVQRKVTEPHEERVKKIRSEYTRLEVEKFREIMGTLDNLDIKKAKKKLNTICGGWYNEPPTNY